MRRFRQPLTLLLALLFIFSIALSPVQAQPHAAMQKHMERMEKDAAYRAAADAKAAANRASFEAFVRGVWFFMF